MAGANSQSRLHGRSGDLEALDRRLDTAASGRGQLAFVEGEGGMGKSSLVAEVVALAEASCFQVFEGHSEQLERSRPFGALVDALACRRGSPDPKRGAIAELITGAFSGTAQQEGLHAPAPAFLVVDEFLELIETLARTQPLLLALEDLHWADASTLLVVRSLSRRFTGLRVAVVGTFRPSPRRPELDQLLQACTNESCVHITLQPLDETTAAELVAELLGMPPGVRLRSHVRAAGGNPLLIKELISAHAQEGAITTAGGSAEVDRVLPPPPALRQAILQGIGGLPQTVLEMLRPASVLGCTFSFTDLVAVCDRPALSLLPALEEAKRAGLVGEAGAQLCFRHRLVRDAIYYDLPLSVRSALHLHAGRVLAAAGAPAVQVAMHLAAGAAPDDPEAVERLLEAARSWEPRIRSGAEGREAPFRAAETAPPGTPAVDPTAAVTVATSRRSMIALLRGDLHRAIALATEAASSGRSDRRRAYPSRCLLALCLAEADRLDEAAAAVASGRQASEALVPLQTVSGLRRFFAGQWDDAVVDLEAGLRMAAEPDSAVADESTRIAHSAIALIALHRGDLPAAQKHLDAAGRASGRPCLSEWPALPGSLLLEARGDPARALGQLIESWQACARRGWARAHPILVPDLVRLALSEGRADLARAATETVEEAARKMVTASAEGAALRCRGLLEGDPEKLVRAVDAYRKSPRPLPRAAAFEDAGRLLYRAGCRDDASALLHEALEVYRSLGAQRDAARVHSLLRSLGLQPRQRQRSRHERRVGWPSLTQAEIQVARLVAQGLTNRQVGRRLSISPRTVETHLSHIYVKLDISSRVELTLAVTRHPTP
jgi:DNA-binding CsgD family transcriptional regulator